MKLYYPASINEFTLGRVVYMKRDRQRVVEGWDGMAGHVIGFGINSTNEVNIQVRWATGTEQLIHASNLSLEVC